MLKLSVSPVLRVAGKILRDFCPSDGKSVTANGQKQIPLVCVISLQRHPMMTSSIRIDFLLSHARLEHQNISFYLRYRKLEAIVILIEKGG